MIRTLIVLLLTAVPALVGATGGKVQEATLDNGLKVIVKEDHRAPIVTVQVWYRVGSSYEHGGLTGISHVLEHMMFKGTEKHGPGEYSRIVAANGGDENAFTGRDYTAYYQNLAKDRLDVAFELEADRMRHLSLPNEEFLKELEVVKEERRMRTEDDPESLTSEQFNAVAYEASPYRIPVIGWASDLETLQVEDLRAWYKRWYAPNNATLVVVGDVDPEQVLALARKHFAPLEPDKLVPPRSGSDPAQRGEKRLAVKAPAREPYLILGYKATALGHSEEPWEPYALEMLSEVLDGGSSARLAKDLVRGAEVATSAGAGYSAFTRLPGMVTLEGTPAKGRTTAELERALRDEVARLQSEPVGKDELERVRAQVIAGKVFEKDSVFGQAMQIGMLETIGLGWRLADEYVERLQQVTPEQVQAVARKYLTDDNLTVAVLDPQPLDGKTERHASAGGHHDIR